MNPERLLPTRVGIVDLTLKDGTQSSERVTMHGN
jgi:hypothetical protein